MISRMDIQNAIVERVLSPDTLFPQVTYTGVVPDSVDQTDPAPVVPKVAVNEVASVFGQNSRHGMSYQQYRTQWLFKLILKFPSEVDLGRFEQAWFENPVRVVREQAGKSPLTYFLLLQSSDVEHPPMQGASNGTNVVYTITASTLAPK